MYPFQARLQQHVNREIPDVQALFRFGRMALERNPQLSLATRGEYWASQGQPKGKAEIRVVTRESRRNSRKTTWFPPLGKMRPLPATASQGKSPVPP